MVKVQFDDFKVTFVVVISNISNNSLPHVSKRKKKEKNKSCRNSNHAQINEKEIPLKLLYRSDIPTTVTRLTSIEEYHMKTFTS